MSSDAGGIDHDSLQSLQSECDHLRHKCKKYDQLKTEHRAMMQEYSTQTDKVTALNGERSSLLATIQMLQQELMEAEEIRMSLVNK